MGGTEALRVEISDPGLEIRSQPGGAQMGCVRALAFAKINLFLAVGPRRPDGYHEVDTVLQAVKLADLIEVAERPDGQVALEALGDFPVPAGQENLCWRAAQAARDAWAPGRGLQMTLTKNVPVAAGLGGGSSDAAAVLLAAEALWQAQPTGEERLALAASLGSDVPFFVVGGTAAASGRGERIHPLPPAPPMWLVVGKPAESVSTAVAYGRFDRIGRLERATSEQMRAALASGDRAAIAALLYNDLEPAVLPVARGTARLKADLLSAGCLGALMAGSGSAAFGIAADEAQARQIARDLAERYPWVRAVRTVSQGCGITACPQEADHADA